MNRLRQSLSLFKKLNQTRFISVTAKRNSDHHVERRKATWLWPAEEEHYYRGYTYRELRNLQGEKNSQIVKYALGVMWFFIFYSMWNKPLDLLGHAPYPDTSKWTDEELGIPPDDQE